MCEYICDSCGHEVNDDEVKIVNDGIGPYEFWGEIGYDYRPAAVSPCCEGELVEGGCTLLEDKVRVARKDHKDGKVKKGDRYRVRTYRHWREDGPSWITSEKTVLAPIAA